MPGVPPARYAYLGPVGTFAEAAVRTIPAASRGELQPQASVAAALEAVRSEVQVLMADLSAARADLSDALRHVAVVRYDAFGDMGGMLSFSAALFDDNGDGLVISSINGRSETRTYAKGVRSGASDHTMSPEEQQAIAYATRAEIQPEEADLIGASRRRRRG